MLTIQFLCPLSGGIYPYGVLVGYTRPDVVAVRLINGRIVQAYIHDVRPVRRDED